MLFNKRLREMRMKRGFTQQNMADMLSVALRTYQCYETGSRSPSLELLVHIADILDISTDYLLCRDDFIQSHAISVDEC